MWQKIYKIFEEENNRILNKIKAISKLRNININHIQIILFLKFMLHIVYN